MKKKKKKKKSVNVSASHQSTACREGKSNCRGEEKAYICFLGQGDVAFLVNNISLLFPWQLLSSLIGYLCVWNFSAPPGAGILRLYYVLSIITHLAPGLLSNQKESHDTRSVIGLSMPAYILPEPNFRQHKDYGGGILGGYTKYTSTFRR